MATSTRQKRQRTKKDGRDPLTGRETLVPSVHHNDLPTNLKIGIFEGSELISIVDIPDPRIGFCQFWEEFHIDTRRQLKARPLVEKVVAT